jgi:CRISPR-associated protein Csx10
VGDLVVTLRLRLEIIRATAPGTGQGLASHLDREVATDHYGLPFVAARGVKGLLRETAREIEQRLVRELGLDDARLREWMPLDDVFGEVGSNLNPGALDLGDLRVEGYPELRDWIAWGAQPRRYGAFLTRERVLSTFTEERAQTAIDPGTGAPLAHTLRQTRVLRPGLRFFGHAALPPAANDSTPASLVRDARHRGLALACAGVKRLGMSRNRMSRVALRLDWVDGAASTDLTTGVLDELRRALAGGRVPSLHAGDSHE